MSDLTRLSNILPQAAGKNLTQYVALNKAWKDCAGDTIAFMTTVSKFDNGILNIAVHDQNWLSELNFMKGELTESIAQMHVDVTSLRFFFRPQKKQPAPQSIARKKMTDQEKSYADRLVDTIADPDLQNSFRRAMYSYFTVYSLDDYLKY